MDTERELRDRIAELETNPSEDRKTESDTEDGDRPSDDTTDPGDGISRRRLLGVGGALGLGGLLGAGAAADSARAQAAGSVGTPSSPVDVYANALDGDLTAGDRLESLVGGNLSIDDGTLTAPSGGGDDHGVRVDASDGAAAVQAALEDAAADGHDAVYVSGGDATWTTSIEVPNDLTLHVSNAVSVTVPEDHDLTRYDMNGSDVLSLITNRDRDGAEGVTIRGGEYDLSSVTDETGYAGIWLHDCTNGSIDDVVCRGAGTPVYGHGSIRSFNLLLSRCVECEIRDSEGHGAGYDNIGVRGGNEHCRVVRSGGTGGSSGTIQSARWGSWGLTGAPTNITYENCWGRRIYDHGGRNVTFDGCRNAHRIQTIGSDNVCVRNTQNYRGKVLLYTYGDDSSNLKVENMSFAADSDKDEAITVGLNGGDLSTLSITNVEARRGRFLRFDSYGSSGNDLEWAEVSNCAHYAPDDASTSSFVSQEDDLLVPDVLRVSDSVCHDAYGGIHGSYGAVRVRNCAFRNVTAGPVDVDADDVETSAIDEW